MRPLERVSQNLNSWRHLNILPGVHYKDTMLPLLPFRYLISLLLTLLVLPAMAKSVRAEEIADGERDFVRQLQAKQFYDLAEQFCERQSKNCRTADDRAAWQLMLADSREQHAWILKEPGRTQLLTHAVQKITDFVRNEPPRAELDLLLRVRQIELLSVIARIDATVAEFGPKAGLLKNWG